MEAASLWCHYQKQTSLWTRDRTPHTNATELKKANAFQLRGPQKILGLSTTFVKYCSNTNEYVLQKAHEEIGHTPGTPSKIKLFSDLLKDRRVKLAGHILRSNNSDPLRRVSYERNSAVSYNVGKRGVPSNSGYSILVDICLGNIWKRNVRKYCGTESQFFGTCKKPSILSIAVACSRFRPCATSLARNHGSQKREDSTNTDGAHQPELIKGCDSSHSYDTLLTHYIPLYTTITTILYTILCTIMYILVLDSIIYQLIYHWYIIYRIPIINLCFLGEVDVKMLDSSERILRVNVRDMAGEPSLATLGESKIPGKSHGIHGGLYIPCDIPQWSWW